MVRFQHRRYAVVGGVILMALDLVLNETKGKLRDAKEDRS
jgi:hypothetical protein